jgi:alcohol dehydrogenase
MKALVYTQPNEVQIQERPLPQAAPGEVVLKIEAVGICGSDLHAYHGHDPRRQPGLVLGHEFCGEIIESNQTTFKVGQRVTGNPLITCGVCEYCVSGRNNLCSDRTMVGMTRPGAFAQYMSIPASSLVDIPQQMPASVAALTEPAATAVHALALSMRHLHRPLPECRTLVIGGGAIGMLSALLLKSYGVHQLTVAETNTLRLASLHQHVGCTTINPITTEIAPSSMDYVIDAVGSKATRNAAFAAIKPGGVIMHIGLQDWASEIDMRKLTLSEITLLGTYTYSTADLRATVQKLHEGAFGDLSWVEERRMEEAPQAFNDLHHGRTPSAKVLLIPEAA